MSKSIENFGIRGGLDLFCSADVPTEKVVISVGIQQLFDSILSIYLEKGVMIVNQHARIIIETLYAIRHDCL